MLLIPSFSRVATILGSETVLTTAVIIFMLFPGFLNFCYRVGSALDFVPGLYNRLFNRLLVHLRFVKIYFCGPDLNRGGLDSPETLNRFFHPHNAMLARHTLNRDERFSHDFLLCSRSIHFSA